MLPTEQRLLLLSCAEGVAEAEFRGLARQPIDWPRLTRLAAQWRASAALWHRVAAVPELQGAESAKLRAQAVVQEFRLLHIRRLLDGIVARLAAEGIEVMLLKGAALLAENDARPVVRSMGDVDLLVVRGSPERAWRMFRDEGWVPGDPSWTEERYAVHHHLPPLVDPHGVDLGLEMHRSVLPAGSPPLLDEAGMLARARRLVVGHTPVLAPSLEDMLLHACVHYAWQHALEFGGWRTFVDAHALAGDASFSWDRFLGLVSGTPSASCCYWTLRLAHHGTRLAVPPTVLERLRPRVSPRVALGLERHFFGQMVGASVEDLPLRLRRAFWTAAIRPRRSGLGQSRPWRMGVDVRHSATDRMLEPEVGADPGALARSRTTIGYLMRIFRTSSDLSSTLS